MGTDEAVTDPAVTQYKTCIMVDQKKLYSEIISRFEQHLTRIKKCVLMI